MTPDAPSPMRYTVRRRNWRVAPAALVRLPGDGFVAGFWTAFDAESLRARLELAARAAVPNPFGCGLRWDELSNLPEWAFADFVQEGGVMPPPQRSDGGRNWAAWWHDRRKFWTPPQVARLFDGLDRLRFFDVVARPLDRTAFVVVEPVWEPVPLPDEPPDLDVSFRDLPRGHHPGTDGGNPVRVYRQFKDAQAEVALAAEARCEPPATGEVVAERLRRPPHNNVCWVPRWWVCPNFTSGKWDDPIWLYRDDVPPFQIEEVEYDDTGGPPAGGMAFAVCRTAWRNSGGVTLWRQQPWRMTPVVVCTRQTQAERRAGELDCDLRSGDNPFRYQIDARPSGRRLMSRLSRPGQQGWNPDRKSSTTTISTCGRGNNRRRIGSVGGTPTPRRGRPTCSTPRGR